MRRTAIALETISAPGEGGQFQESLGRLLCTYGNEGAPASLTRMERALTVVAKLFPGTELDQPREARDAFRKT